MVDIRLITPRSSYSHPDNPDTRLNLANNLPQRWGKCRLPVRLGLMSLNILIENKIKLNLVPNSIGAVEKSSSYSLGVYMHEGCPHLGL